MPWVPGLMVRILTHERAHAGQRPLPDALIDAVRRNKLAGVTVSRAIEGASDHGRPRTGHVLELGEDPLITIEIVDRKERIEPLLPHFASLVTSGVLAVIDVRLYFPASSLTVGDIMREPRIAVRPDAPLSKALIPLLDDGVRLVPVIAEHEVLAGIVTLGHLLRAADSALGAHLLEVHRTPEHVRSHLDRLIQGRTVRDVMIAQPHVLKPEVTLEEAARDMVHHHITRTPVVDTMRHLVGLISERMLVSALVAPVVQSTQHATPFDGPIARPEDAELSGMLRQGVHPAAGQPLTAGLLADRTIPVIVESAHWEEVVNAVQGSSSCLVVVVTAEGHLRGLIDEQALLEHAVPSIGGVAAGLGYALRRTLRRAPGQVFGALRGHPAHQVTAADLQHTAPLAVPEAMPIAEALATMVQGEQTDVAVVVSPVNRPLGVLRRNEALRALVSG